MCEYDMKGDDRLINGSLCALSSDRWGSSFSQEIGRSAVSLNGRW